jgi:hypothetical protein
MPMFIFENLESRKIASADAVNRAQAQLDLGDEWHVPPAFVRLVPHSEVRKLFDEAVSDEREANRKNSPDAKQLKARREALAQIVARL